MNSPDRLTISCVLSLLTVDDSKIITKKVIDRLWVATNTDLVIRESETERFRLIVADTKEEAMVKCFRNALFYDILGIYHYNFCSDETKRKIEHKIKQLSSPLYDNREEYLKIKKDIADLLTNDEIIEIVTNLVKDCKYCDLYKLSDLQIIY